jgi:hypothetical protein
MNTSKSTNLPHPWVPSRDTSTGKKPLGAESERPGELVVKPELSPHHSKAPLILSGTLVSGARQAAFFTQLDWVQSQCLDQLGFRPFPGTLNLRLFESDRTAAAVILNLPGLPPPGNTWTTR